MRGCVRASTDRPRRIFSIAAVMVFFIWWPTDSDRIRMPVLKKLAGRLAWSMRRSRQLALFRERVRLGCQSQMKLDTSAACANLVDAISETNRQRILCERL